MQKHQHIHTRAHRYVWFKYQIFKLSKIPVKAKVIYSFTALFLDLKMCITNRMFGHFGQYEV